MKNASKKYKSVALEMFFDVSRIIEISYRGIPVESLIDRGKNVDFWCFYYIDRGKANLHNKDGEVVELSQGNGIFYAPGNSFEYSSSGKEGANILSVFFRCDNLEKEFFDGRIKTFDTFERMILSELVNIGQFYFERHSNMAGGEKGTKPKQSAPPYVPHLVKASIEFLLLRIYKNKKEKKAINKSNVIQNNLTVNVAVEYMYENVGKKLTVAEIAATVKMSESNFQSVFRKAKGQSVMNYFNNLKAEQAKIMLRKAIYTHGEIAAALGFSSESYFTRHFKKITGMTPTEYARLIYYG